MKDLADPRWITLKGVLFLLIGLASAALLLLDRPDIRTGLLLGLALWSFCRAYYFAFYVIQHYIDPGFRYSGLISFARYFFSRRNHPPGP